ncbi:MAG TPA: hypothetical protein VHI52_00115, partial [Verrucomicrobiae bacterium]|nr:hypothetical protein [Verrucomicrobiae bacterium]
MSSRALRKTAAVAVPLITATLVPLNLSAQNVPPGDAARGKVFFQVNCAVCHSPELGPDNLVIMKQGPSLVGVV